MSLPWMLRRRSRRMWIRHHPWMRRRWFIRIVSRILKPFRSKEEITKEQVEWLKAAVAECQSNTLRLQAIKLAYSFETSWLVAEDKRFEFLRGLLYRVIDFQPLEEAFEKLEQNHYQIVAFMRTSGGADHDAVAESHGHKVSNRRDLLPPELWAHVFEFLPFSDVCRMTRVSSMFCSEVIHLVRTLHIDHESALTPIQAFRFPLDNNVEEVVIGCEFKVFVRSSFDPLGHRCDKFDTRPTYLLSFLCRFPKLKHVFIGNGIHETKSEILARLCLEGDVDSGYDYVTQLPVDYFDPSNVKTYNALSYSSPGCLRDLLITRVFGTNAMLSQNVRVYGLLGGFHTNRNGLCFVCQAISRLEAESQVHPGAYLP